MNIHLPVTLMPGVTRVSERAEVQRSDAAIEYEHDDL